MCFQEVLKNCGGVYQYCTEWEAGPQMSDHDRERHPLFSVWSGEKLKPSDQQIVGTLLDCK